jgi:hypothetical protein
MLQVATETVVSDTATIYYPNDASFVAGIAGIRTPDMFMLRWRGQLTVPQTGAYDFKTASDDGSLLYIDQALIVDNDGWHGRREVTGTASLDDGPHELTALMFEDTGGCNFEVYWTPIPGAALVGLEGAALSNAIVPPTDAEINGRRAAALSFAVQSGSTSRGAKMCPSCNENIDMIFRADRGNLLTGDDFRQICKWEKELRSMLLDKSLNSHVGCAQMESACCPAISLPRLLSDVLGKPCAEFTDSDITIGLQLARAFLPAEANSTLHDVLLGIDFDEVQLRTDHTRSLLCLAIADPDGDGKFSRDSYQKDFLQVWDNGLESWYEAAQAERPGLEMVIFNSKLRDEYFKAQLFRDLYLAGGAFLCMLFALLLHTGSICLALLGMLHILASVPIGSSSTD